MFSALTASVGGTRPSGSVSFYEGSQLLCDAAPIDGFGDIVTSTCVIQFPDPGAHIIVAKYSGDAANAAFDSATFTVIVGKGDTNLSLVLTPDSVKVGSPVTAAIQLALANGIITTSGPPRGTVTISDGTDNCTIGLPGQYSANSCTFNPTNAGSFVVTATYSGEARFNTSSATAALTVNSGATPTVTTLQVSPYPSSYGQQVTLTANVAGGDSLSGSLTYFDGPLMLCTTGVQQTCNASALSAGVHQLSVSYSGDANNQSSSSVPLSYTVAKANTGIALTTTKNSIVFGNSVNVTLQIGQASYYSNPPTGTVTVSDGSATCSVTLPNVSCSLTPTSTGNQVLTASYGGDGNYDAATATATLNVTSATSGVALATSASPSVVGNAITFTAVVSGTSPTGSVTFVDVSNGQNITLCNTVPLSATPASATCTISWLAAAAHTITASYSGDGNNAPASSPSINQIVSTATSITASSLNNPVGVNQSVQLTATLVGVIYPYGGTISFNDGAVSLCSMTYPTSSDNGARTYTCSVTFATAGSHRITAQYWGDAYHTPSTSAPFEQVVTPVIFGVVSRKTHGSAGTFDIPINLTAAVDSSSITVEPRQTEAGGKHRLVFTFPNPVNSVNSVQLSGVAGSKLGSGDADAPIFTGNTVTVTLTNVPDRKRLQVTLRGLNGVVGTDATVAIGYLMGDVTQDRQVSGIDVVLTGAHSPAAASATTMFYNISLSGSVSALDRALVAASSPKGLE